MWKGEQQCRYLDGQGYLGKTVYICRKLSPFKTMIDEEVDEYKNKTFKSSPSHGGVPLGDNCSGYLVLLSKPQGYDVKGK